MKLTAPVLLCVPVLLAACSSKPSNIDINSGGARSVQTQSRSEPIFYNGKHYALNYSYNDAMKAFDMKVSGTTSPMKADAQKDAVNIASSSLGYFACPDGQRGRLVGAPKFKGGVWALQARCG
jgi:ABC-type Fe3+-citrate transport system substrate-binding protein